MFTNSKCVKLSLQDLKHAKIHGNQKNMEKRKRSQVKISGRKFRTKAR